MRLFVAIALPDPIADQVAALPRPNRPGVRWTTRSQWHVTLRFLGEAPPDEIVAAVHAALEKRGRQVAPMAEVGPSTAWFPGRRVLQVPVAGVDPVADAIRPATRSWGPADEPPFSGHLTLARTAGRRRGPPDLAGARLSARFAVAEIGVYASRPSRQGSVYEQLSSHPLVSPGATTDPP